MSLWVNQSRLRDSFDRYSGIGATDGGGLDRVALSEADKRARDRFVSELHGLDLDVWIDEVGNVFGRRPGRDETLAPVLLGSHLDSQPNGGRYDGQLGVLCALETFHLLADDGVVTDRPIEIVNWTNEEGTRFNLAPLGSGTFSGEFGVSEALSTTDRDGVSVREALSEIGYDGDVPCEPYPIHSYLELHIEQSTVLERNNDQIGVVEGVVGIEWLRVTIQGTADHAGTTPMHARQDAAATAVGVIDNLRSVPGYLNDDVVLTVGEIDVRPGSINVIPREVTFTVDIRCYDDETRSEAVEHVRNELAAATERHGTTFETESLLRIDHTELSPLVRAAILDASRLVEADSRPIISRATHDAMYLTAVCDAGLVFVPSVDGQSHSEAEYTEWDNVVTGANAYANAALSLATTD